MKFTVVSFTLYGVGTVFVPHGAARLRSSLVVLMEAALFMSRNRMLLQKIRRSISYKDYNCYVGVDVPEIKEAIMNIIVKYWKQLRAAVNM